MSLTKADLIDQIYTIHNMSKAQASEAVEAFLEISKNCLCNGDDLLFSGFGKFCVKEKRARLGRNPQTGESLTLDARRVVVFHPSGKLKDRVNGR